MNTVIDVERHLDQAAQILATLLLIPAADRLNALAIAIRAALDAEVVW